MRLTIISTPEGLGVILPADALNRLGLAEGDKLFAEVRDGAIFLTIDDDHAEQVRKGREIAQRYSGAMNALAGESDELLGKAKEIMARRRDVLRKLGE